MVKNDFLSTTFTTDYTDNHGFKPVLTADEPAFAKATAWQAQMNADSEQIFNH
jgi:hypothetical protein